MSVWRWVVLLFCCGLAWSAQAESRVVGYLLATDMAHLKARLGEGVLGLPGVRQEEGPVWVIVNYLARDSGEAEGETRFEVYPEAVPVPMGENITTFRAKAMTRQSASAALAFGLGQYPEQLSKATVSQLLGYEQAALILRDETRPLTHQWADTLDQTRWQTIAERLQAQEDRSAALTEYQQLGEEEYQQLRTLLNGAGPVRQLALLKQFVPSAKASGSLGPLAIHLDFNAAKDMTPLLVEVIVGQGEVPEVWKDKVTQAGATARQRLLFGFITVGVALLAFRFWLRWVRHP